MSIATQLGNGVGIIYFTGNSGTFPCPFSEAVLPQVGIANNRLGQIKAISAGKTARKSAESTYANFVVEITNAAADNLTVFTINGVSQITGVVAMTAGDEVASAADIATNMNGTVTAPEWSAFANNGFIYITATTIGASLNGLNIVLTFSGASTADYPSQTSGGRDAGQYDTRIWLDPSISASPTVMGGGAIDITEALAALPPTPVNTAVVVSNAITLDRKDKDTVWLVSGGNFETINMLDAVEGDTVTLRGDTAAGAPATVETGSGNIFIASGADFELSTDTDAISFTYINGNWQESNTHGSTREDLRALGVSIPKNPTLAGVEIATMPVAGNYSIAPGKTGGGPDTGKYNVTFKGATAVLVGNVNIILEHSLPGQQLQEGDEGFIFVEQMVTAGAFSLSVIDTDAVINITVPKQILAAGKWGFNWIFDGTQFSGSFVPNVTATGWTTTAMYGDATVTNAKIVGMDGSKLVAASVPFTALNASTQALFGGLAATYKTVDIPTARVKTLQSNPFDITDMPAVAGQAYIILNAATQVISYAGTAYNAGDVVWLKTFGATVPQMIDNNTLQATVATMRRMLPNDSALAAGATQIIANAKMQVTSSADPTLGNSDIRVHIWYIAVPL